jgi:ABC-type uncharacterized transport system ATPase subunit
MVISNLIEAIVSVKRISSFLDSEELQTDARDVILKENIQDGDEVLSIANAEFYWSKDGKEPTLQDINLTVRKGELIAVLGQVGAGKAGIPSVFCRTKGVLIVVFNLLEQFVVRYHRSDEEDRRQNWSVWNCRLCSSEPLVCPDRILHPSNRSSYA